MATQNTQEEAQGETLQQALTISKEDLEMMADSKRKNEDGETRFEE